MAILKVRPKIIDYCKMLDHKAKVYASKYGELKDRLQKVLMHGDFPDARLVKTSSIKVDNDKALKWALKNLNDKDFESLFVKMFDKNAFLTLVREKKLENKVPKGIITAESGQFVKFYHDKTAEG